METQFYLHLSSEDSKTYFPGNDTGTFTVKLPEILQLKGSWEVALGKTSPLVEGYYSKIINLFSTSAVYTSENTRSGACHSLYKVGVR